MRRAFQTPQAALRHYVTGAIERGEGTPIVEQIDRKRFEQEGRDAYTAGVKLSRSPYVRYTPQHAAWVNGWRAERRDTGNAPGKYL